MKRLATSLRKLALLVGSEMIGNPLGYWCIGLINRAFLGRRLNSVFLYYSVNRAY